MITRADFDQHTGDRTRRAQCPEPRTPSRRTALTAAGDPRAVRHAARHLATALQIGDCPTDAAFDRFLPEPLQMVSSQYWSPLRVAKRAAEWLGDAGIHSVVDIGSGAGKFCVLGALVGKGRFVGLEQHSFLVDSARALARLFDVDDRVRFIHGALGEVPLPGADAYYLFNPFGEYSFESGHLVDSDIDCSDARRLHDIAAAELLLQRLPERTWVLTLNGFGGRMPEEYELIRADWELAALRLWRKPSTRAQAPKIPAVRHKSKAKVRLVRAAMG